MPCRPMTMTSKAIQYITTSMPPKILVIQGEWNAKVGLHTRDTWKNFIGPSCNRTSNEFARYCIVLVNTPGEHKAPRIWTWYTRTSWCKEGVNLE